MLEQKIARNAINNQVMEVKHITVYSIGNEKPSKGVFVFVFSTLKMSFSSSSLHCFCEKLVVILIIVFLYVLCLFLWMLLRFCLYLFIKSYTDVSRCLSVHAFKIFIIFIKSYTVMFHYTVMFVLVFYLSCLGFISFSGSVGCCFLIFFLSNSFIKFWRLLSSISSNVFFSIPFCFSSSSGTTIKLMLDFSVLSTGHSGSVHFFFSKSFSVFQFA